MITILETANNLDLSGSHSTFYIKTLNLRFHRYTSAIELVDLTNAMQKGMTCKRVMVRWDHHNFNDSIFWNFLNDNYNGDLLAFVKSRISEADEVIAPNLACEMRFQASNRTYSPFTVGSFKKLDKLPTKWTLTHAIKALVNGQYKAFKCDGVYTDDYAFDAACNFQKGEIKDPNGMIKELVEEPSGWRSSISGGGLVDVDCYHFDNNSFELAL
jgi:hypothetical protein